MVKFDEPIRQFLLLFVLTSHLHVPSFGFSSSPMFILVSNRSRAIQPESMPSPSDVNERGIGSERSNGRQKYWQENKSVAQVRAYAEQQRKHLSELRLTPNSRKAAPVMIDDEFANF